MILTINNVARTELKSIIKPNSSEIIELDLSKEIKDGGYYIEFKHNGKLKNKSFGYFTNGSPTENMIRLNIREDTIITHYPNL
jgi:hypothetical protein